MSDLAQESSGEVKVAADTLEKLRGMKSAIHASLGQVVLAMTSVPRYRHQSLADLAHLVIDPLARDCIAIASPKNIDGNDPRAVLAPAAIVIWASVSEEVDAKIREQVKAGAFPVRLKQTEWKSGDKVWLLDVIAPTRELATMVLTHFHQIGKRDNVTIHPMVAHVVDPEILAKLSASSPENSATGNSKTVN